MPRREFKVPRLAAIIQHAMLGERPGWSGTPYTLLRMATGVLFEDVTPTSPWSSSLVRTQQGHTYVELADAIIAYNKLWSS